MDVMMRFDGEEEDHHLDASSSAAEQETLAALEELREGVRTYVELKTDSLEPKFDGMWATIERRIEANGHAAEEAEAAPVPKVRKQSAQQDGMFARLKEWLGVNRGYVFTSAMTAAAVALVMFAIRPTEVKQKIVQVPGETKVVKVPVEKIVYVPKKTDQVTVVGPAAVDSLDVTEGTTGAVLRIPGEDGENATTVIWLSPEEDPI